MNKKVSMRISKSKMRIKKEGGFRSSLGALHITTLKQANKKCRIILIFIILFKGNELLSQTQIG